MEYEHALEIIGGTIVMCRSITKAMERVPIDELLSIPVKKRPLVFNNEYGHTVTQTKEYALYACQNKIYEIDVVDVRAVCDYIMDNWPSSNAKTIRDLLFPIFQECFRLFKKPIDSVKDEGDNYFIKLCSPTPCTIGAIINNTIHEIQNTLELTGIVVFDNDKQIDNNFELSEDLAYHIDWIEVTKDFDQEKIKDAVTTIGRNKKERKLIVEAIYEAASSSGYFTEIPFNVDKILDQLHKEYDDNHRGILFDYDERSERINYYSFIERKRERFRKQDSNNYIGSRGHLTEGVCKMRILEEKEELKKKIQMLEQEKVELLQHHEEDDARMLSGFGAPIVEVYENGIKAVNQQIYDTDKNHRIIESKSQNEPGMSFVKTKSIVKNHFIETTGKLIVNSSPTHEKEQKEIPTKCVKAVTKVVTESITINGTVLISQTQLRKAVTLIDLDKNTEIGILLVICREVGIVKPSARNVDFVRALIGMRILKYEDDKKIERIAHGFSDKIQNLESNHKLWGRVDKTLGEKLYDALIKG